MQVSSPLEEDYRQFHQQLHKKCDHLAKSRRLTEKNCKQEMRDCGVVRSCLSNSNLPEKASCCSMSVLTACRRHQGHFFIIITFFIAFYFLFSSQINYFYLIMLNNYNKVCLKLNCILKKIIIMR